MDKNGLLLFYDINKNKSIKYLLKYLEYEIILKQTAFLDPVYGANIKLSQRIWHIKNDIFDIQRCPICGTQFIYSKSRKKYVAQKGCVGHSISKSMSDITADQWNGMIEKRKKTNLEKYGVEHNMLFPAIQEKYKQNSIKKWGTSNPMQSDTVKEKLSKSLLSTYGVDNYRKSTEFKKKAAASNLLRCRRSNYAGSDEYYNDRQCNRVDDVVGRDYEIIDRHRSCYKLKHLSCDNIFDIDLKTMSDRIKNNHEICTNCNPLSKQYSSSEKEVVDFIKS